MSENSMRAFTMVGPRGVGKTSLLSAMYDELSDMFARNFKGCSFTPDSDSRAKINDRRNELIETTKKFSMETGIGIKGSIDEEITAFNLNIGSKNLDMRFVDLPGGWYTNGTAEQYTDAINRVATSAVTLLAVDAVALMESPPKKGEAGKNHLTVNNVKAIQDFYTKALSCRRQEEHSIIIVLIRAETYRNSGKIAEMYEQLRKSYLPFVENLRNQLHGKLRINVFACFVETVGTLYFNTYKMTEGGEVAKYVCPDRTYKPDKCSIPLRLLFSEAMRLEHGTVQNTVKQKEQLLADLRNKEEELRRAISECEEILRKKRGQYTDVDTIFGNLVEWWYGNNSTLAQKRQEFLQANEDYEQAEDNKNRCEEEVRQARTAYEQAGEVADTISDVLTNLKNGLKDDEYIKL